MEWWVALGTTISEAGGWAAFLGLGSLILVGLYRRWWVPGFWDTEKSTALEKSVKANEELEKANADLRLTNATLRSDLRRERRRRRTDA